MPQLRYFGIDHAEGAIDPARADLRLGQFVAWAEPLPVGTEVELDGVPYRVTRVDEGLAPGVWLLADNQTMRDIPLHLENTPTAPSPPPVIVSDVTMPPPAPAAVAASETVEATPPAIAPAAAVEPEPEPEGSGRKRRRKARKTMVGR